MEMEKRLNIPKWSSSWSVGLEFWLNQREEEQGVIVTERVPQTDLTEDLH